MKKFSLLTLLVSLTSPLFSQGLQCLDFADFYYLGFRESVSFHNTVAFEQDLSGTPTTTEFKYKTGWGLHLQAGLGYNNFRFEGEFSYRRNDLKNFTILQPGEEPFAGLSDGYRTYTSFMFNIYYDLYCTDCFGLYVGGGPGLTFFRRERTAGTISGSDILTRNLARNKTYFCWQALTGLFYDYHKLRFSLGYSFFATETSSLVSGIKSNEIPYTHNIDFGIKYLF